MKKIEVGEMPVGLFPDSSIENVWGVQKRTWRKWNIQCRFIFNNVYAQMDQNMAHPKQPRISDELWDTIRWNSAWLAADAAWQSVNISRTHPDEPRATGNTSGMGYSSCRAIE